MKPVNIVVLAGDRKASKLIDHENKAFLPIHGVPSVVHVLRAFLQSEAAANIVVVGPAERLRKVFGEYDLPLESRIKVIEQGESLIENGKAGFIASLEGVSDDTPFESLRGSDHTDTPIVVTSCDIPLITPREIDEFIRGGNMTDNDFCIGLCSEEVLKHYYPSDGAPGIRLNYFHMREGNFRINNLNLIKPLRIERLNHIERMYELRYQTHIVNFLKLIVWVLFKSRGVFKILHHVLILWLAFICFNRNATRMYRRFKNSVKIGKVLKSIGTSLGSRISSINTSYGGAALDMDNAKDRQIIEEMYDRWMKHQESLVPPWHDHYPSLSKG